LDYCPTGSSCVGSTCVCRGTGQPACGGTCCPPTACQDSGHLLFNPVCVNGRCVYSIRYCLSYGLVCDPVRGGICPNSQGNCGPWTSGRCCTAGQTCINAFCK